MKQSRLYPEINRLSILAALILLAYAVTQFVDIPAFNASITVFGVVLNFQLNLNTYVSVLVPGFAAVGAYWLLSTHPSKEQDRYPLLHCILPSLTAWVIGLPLATIPFGIQWWVVFSLGGLLLIVVLVAEYSVIDIRNESHAIASGVLQAISYALYLFLLIAIRASGLRLYLVLPALVLPAFLLLTRTFYLQLNGKWLTTWAFGITAVIGQMTVGLHYLPVNPLSFGLILLSPLYALTDLAISIDRKKTLNQIWVGPLLMSSIFLLLAFLL